MAEVAVVARLRAKTGQEEKVRRELLHLVDETHKESGCIKYDLHQSLDDKAQFVFYEIWQSKEALDDHLDTPHLVRLSSMIDELFAEEPVIELFEMISEPKSARR